MLTASYPVKPRGVPGVRVRARVREECKHHRFCKCGRTAGQGTLDGSKDRARFYGSLKGGGECHNMLHSYTDTHPGNDFTFSCSYAEICWQNIALLHLKFSLTVTYMVRELLCCYLNKDLDTEYYQV